jgi:hypothetical protein
MSVPTKVPTQFRGCHKFSPVNINGNYKRDGLQKFFMLPSDMPFSDTLNRVFATLLPFRDEME